MFCLAMSRTGLEMVLFIFLFGHDYYTQAYLQISLERLLYKYCDFILVNILGYTVILITLSATYKQYS